MDSAHAAFAAAIRERLAARKLSARAAASNAGLPERSVQGVLDGHVPSIERAARICAALDLEFHLGPAGARAPAREQPPGASGPGSARAARDGRALGEVERHLQGLVGAVAAAGGNPFPPDLHDDTLAALLATHDAPPGTRPVDVAECAEAPGAGPEPGRGPVRGLAWFARSWLDRHGLDATRCAIVRVRGDAMAPTLPDGCSVLIDRNRRARRERGIYAVRTGGGLIVRRAARRGRGWALASDNPAGAAEPWPADTETIGEVVWAAQTLIEPRRG